MIERKKYKLPDILLSPEFSASFCADIRSVSDQLSALCDWKEEPSNDFMNKVMKLMHMLRGASGSLNFTLVFDIAEIVHRLCEIGASFARNQREDYQTIASLVKQSQSIIIQIQIDLMKGDVSVSTKLFESFIDRIEPLYGNYFYKTDTDDFLPENEGGKEDFFSFIASFDTTPSKPSQTSSEKNSNPSDENFEAYFNHEIDEPASEEILKYFYQELEENLQTLESVLLNLEKGINETYSLEHIFRIAHSTKGSANSMGLKRIGRMMHGIETLFEPLRERSSIPESIYFTAGLDCVKLIRRLTQEAQSRSFSEPLASDCTSLYRRMVSGSLTSSSSRSEEKKKTPLNEPEKANVESPEKTPTKKESLPVPTEFSPSNAVSFRVDREWMDGVMDMIGELVISRNRLAAQVSKLSDHCNQLQRSRKMMRETLRAFSERFDYTTRTVYIQNRFSSQGVNLSRESEFSDLQFDRYDEFNVLSRKVSELGNDTDLSIKNILNTHESISEESSTLNRFVNRIQQDISKARLTSVKTLFQRLELSVRDAARHYNIEVSFSAKGDTVEVDRIILDELYESFIHIVRNSVAHGFNRASPSNRIQIEARQSSGRVYFVLSDNGSGLDIPLIRQRAIEKGLLDSNVKREEDIIAVLFHQGFTTRTTVDDLAGRGIGLDVVKATIERFGGSIRIASVAGKGCSVFIEIPVTLSIEKGVYFKVNGEAFAAPMASISSIHRMMDLSVDSSSNLCIIHNQKLIPALDLSMLFNQSPANRLTAYVIFCSLPSGVYGFIVDDVEAQHDMVIKALGPLLSDHPYFSSATIDASGQIVPIIDIQKLLKTLNITEESDILPVDQTPSEVVQKKRVLIVDDSISIRKICEDYLSGLNLEVVTAGDGIQAINAVKQNVFDVIFTDLEMPRLDGYELIPELRRREATSKVPIVVISSRSAPKHVQKALALGADKCLGKPFTRNDIIEMVNALVTI